jgi:hypothetical protein
MEAPSALNRNAIVFTIHKRNVTKMITLLEFKNFTTCDPRLGGFLGGGKSPNQFILTVP